MAETKTVRIDKADIERIKSMTDDSRSWQGRVQEVVNKAERYEDQA